MDLLDYNHHVLSSVTHYATPDEVFLNTRICDFDLALEDTGYESCAHQLTKELAANGLKYIRPKYYLADEWFCPSGTTNIAIPFWLASRQLRQIEKNKFKHLEGGTKSSFMKLLRHEAGHCVDHAYRLSSRKDWQAVFGSPRRKYNPESYAFNPHSRDYVLHLEKHYAQSHPEEDFAETFAVWLDPRSNWQKVYRYWDGALAKLKFVALLIEEVSSQKPKPTKNSRICSQSRMRCKLKDFYETSSRRFQ